MASSTMVIKVKYGDTLRRFNARVDENDQLDLDMGGLRFKIYSLFNFQLDADITMTYIDEDGDIVTLVDDEDLRDAMRQNMKFLRIDVHEKTDQSEKSYAKSSGSSTPVRYPLPDITPEPIRELISRVPRDLTPNALGPGFADLVDCFSKMGMSYLLQAGGVSGVKNDSSEKPLAPSANDMKGDGKSETILKSTTEESSSKNSRAKDAVNVTKDVGMSNPPQNTPVDLNVRPADSNPSGPTPINVTPVGASLHTAEERKESEKVTSGQVKGKPLGCGGSTSSAIPALTVNDMSNNHFNQCPFSETPIVNDSAPVAYRRLHPFKRNHSEAMGGMFHTGVRCDGCGCHPIIGPRFKSVVKADYDLCRICFSSIGNVAEYIRIDHPLSYRHPRPFKGMHEQPPWMGPSALPKILRNCSAKPGRPKLDSRFVLDVNVMDGTLMAPSTPFTKIWRMRNNGGLIWPKGTQLMWIGGDRFSKSDSVEIEIPAHGVLAENELDIAVDFTAPESPGRYISYWRMASPSGQKFGQRVWVLIQVDTSLKDSFLESFQGLNLNLPPENVVNFPEQMNFPQQHVGSDFVQPSSSNSVKEPAIPIPEKQPENEQDLNFPINDSLLVGHSIPAPTAPVASSTVSYPTVDQSAPAPTAQVASSTVTYPTGKQLVTEDCVHEDIQNPQDSKKKQVGEDSHSDKEEQLKSQEHDFVDEKVASHEDKFLQEKDFVLVESASDSDSDSLCSSPELSFIGQFSGDGFLLERDFGERVEFGALEDIDLQNLDVGYEPDGFDEEDEDIMEQLKELEESTRNDEHHNPKESKPEGFTAKDEKPNEGLENSEQVSGQDMAAKDSEDPNTLETLWEHQELIEQLKMELKKVRVSGLPTILEESESPNMEDLKPWKIDEKYHHVDRMSVLHKFYKTYRERLRKFDILSYQKLYAIGFLQSKDTFETFSSCKSSTPAIKSFLLHNFGLCKPKKNSNSDSDPMVKFIRELHSELEVVYVGQLCLSWEFLQWQYEKALELWEYDEYGLRSYNEVAEEFQQFQVLMQRFVENERFQGPRVETYVKNRCVMRNLMQIPVIREDSMKEKKKAKRKGKDNDDAVGSDILVEILQESIRTIWRFIRADKSANTTDACRKRLKLEVEDSLDPKLFVEVQADLQKKEKKLKELSRSENCILKRFKKHHEEEEEEESAEHLYFFCQVDIKLVSRVLNMSSITTDQLVWCHNKLSRIHIENRKIRVDPSFLLFPC